MAGANAKPVSAHRGWALSRRAAFGRVHRCFHASGGALGEWAPGYRAGQQGIGPRDGDRVRRIHLERLSERRDGRVAVPEGRLLDVRLLQQQLSLARRVHRLLGALTVEPFELAERALLTEQRLERDEGLAVLRVERERAEIVPLGPLRLPPCLLYPSDAADE